MNLNHPRELQKAQKELQRLIHEHIKIILAVSCHLLLIFTPPYLQMMTRKVRNKLERVKSFQLYLNDANE